MSEINVIDTKKNRNEEMRRIFAETTMGEFTRLVRIYGKAFDDDFKLVGRDELNEVRGRLYDGLLPYIENTLVLLKEDGHYPELHFFVRNGCGGMSLSIAGDKNELERLAVAYCAQRMMWKRGWDGVLRNREVDFRIYAYDVDPLIHVRHEFEYTFIMKDRFRTEDLDWWPRLFRYVPVDPYTFAMLHRVVALTRTRTSSATTRSSEDGQQRTASRAGILDLEPELVVFIIQHWLNLHMPQGCSVATIPPFVIPWW